MFPREPFRAAQTCGRVVRERREELGVGGARCGKPAALGKSLEHVLADRVEHVVARRAGGERGGHDRLVDQCRKQIRDCPLVELVCRCDCDEGREGRTAAVDCELLQQRLLVTVQEVVAPLHQPLQCGAARIGHRGIAQEWRAALEDGDELGETEHVHPGGGKLDRERKRVHPPDDLGRERDLLRVGLESGPRRPSAREEELDSLRAERCDGHSRFARDAKHLTARRQDPQLGTFRQQRRRDPSCFLEDVLAGIENDERAGIAKAREHTRERVGATDVDRMRRESDGIVCAAGAREVDEPDAVRELLLEGTRRLDREPALADAGRPGERDEAVLVQQGRDPAELVLAADERRRRRGKVAVAPADDGHGGNRRVVREDRLLQPPELGPRLEPQLVGEHPPRLLERLQCIRLPAAAIERQHQLPHSRSRKGLSASADGAPARPRDAHRARA